ncbi:MAG: hypothetical protein GY847_03475 [Proteobacteria bacterium]|nr:hypothetical protein [Pseudomonadota bacterium]
MKVLGPRGEKLTTPESKVFSHENEVIKLLSNVLSKRPAVSDDTFIESSVLDLRRRLDTKTNLILEDVILQNIKVPKALRAGVYLYPWEAELLNAVYCGEEIILIQGASGCGKTSGLSFLKRYCQILDEAEAPEKCEHKSPPRLLVIDLQDQAEELKTKREREADKSVQTDKLLQCFCNCMDDLLKQVLSEKNAAKLFRKTYLHNPLPEQGHTCALATVKRKVREAAEKELTSVKTWDVILMCLDRGQTSHEKVVSRFLMFDSLASHLARIKNNGLRVILAIDNIDPFPEYLQSRLLETIQSICSAGFQGPLALGGNFSIVLFARLSTIERNEGALDALDPHRIAFRSPDPSEFVFLRLTAFLLNPLSYPQWQSCEKSDQEEILARTWELWERLTSQKSEFSQALSSLAGTNLRTACSLSKSWLLSKRLPQLRGTCPPVDKIQLFLGAATLIRLATAVARAISNGGVPKNEDDLIERLGDSLFDQLLSMLSGHKLVHVKKHGKMTEDGYRHKLAAASRATLQTLLDGKEQEQARESAESIIIAAAWDSAGNQQSKINRGRRLSAKAKKSLLKKEVTLRPKMEELVSAEDASRAKQICQWIIMAISQGLGLGLVPKPHVDARAMFRELASVKAEGSDARLSRWLATSTIISPDSEEGRTEHSALNLFSADGISVSPVALHILCHLQEARAGLYGSEMERRLKAWGFERSQIIQAIADMVSLDRRLIYSGVHDEKENIEKLFEPYHILHISSSGSAYLSYVAATPAYLQWALLEPSELKARIMSENVSRKPVLGRLERALIGLRHIRNDESRRVRNMVETSGVNAQRSLSPFGWIYIGSLTRFMVDMSGIRDRVDRYSAHEIAHSYLKFALEIITDHQKIFGIRQPEWEYKYDHAVDEHKKRFEPIKW